MSQVTVWSQCCLFGRVEGNKVSSPVGYIGPRLMGNDAHPTASYLSSSLGVGLPTTIFPPTSDWVLTGFIIGGGASCRDWVETGPAAPPIIIWVGAGWGTRSEIDSFTTAGMMGGLFSGVVADGVLSAAGSG